MLGEPLVFEFNQLGRVMFTGKSIQRLCGL
jgi:hypothetical protein